MSRSLGQTIGDGLKLSVNYAEQLIQGVTPESFSRMAAPGGQSIHSNHPAFIFGHLALYGPRVVEMTGGQAPVVPEGFSALFAKGMECIDDPDGSVYPHMDEITESFFASYRAAEKAIIAATDEHLAQPNPSEVMVKKFPTLGSMCNFMCSGHMLMHLGQLSAWRRMYGFGPAA
ncbi:MAG: DinB family protein [Fuerstiella sp.]|nr:DinB family protein [Fuerstiella sp.]